MTRARDGDEALRLAAPPCEGAPSPFELILMDLNLPGLDGRDILVRQGAASFRHWFGSPPPMEEMRRAVG